MFVTKEYPNIKFENVEEYVNFKKSLGTATKIEESPFDVVIIRREVVEDENYRKEERGSVC